MPSDEEPVDTLDVLNRAVQDHIQTLWGEDLVMGWVIVTHSKSFERPGSNYRLQISPDLPFHETDGLLRAGSRIQDDIWVDQDDEDDE